MITKENLRYTDSNFYKETKYKTEPIRLVLTDDYIFDPGRIALLVDYPFNLWPVILRFNMIVDPIEDMEPGMLLLIPSLEELKKIEFEQ